MQRSASSRSSISITPPIVHEVLRSPGLPLDSATRGFMEPRFGHDFSGVRVHHDDQAAKSARSMNALAYTIGNHIVFNRTQYRPWKTDGARLLAHELTHVVQQRGRLTTGEAGGLAIADPSSRWEHEAEDAEKAIGGSADIPRLTPFLKSTIQRRAVFVDLSEPVSVGPDGPESDVLDAGTLGDAGVAESESAARLRQLACVKRLGGCTETRSAGVPTESEITTYNEFCRRESAYSGMDITPTAEECRQPTPEPAPQEQPRRSTGADWRGTFGERLMDELVWELGLVDEIDIFDRALDLARRNPRPSPEVTTPEDAFYFWLGWRVPWVQAGGGGIGRLILRLRQVGVRNVRTLAGLRVRLNALFQSAIGRAVDMNAHVARRFLERCLTRGGELEGVTFSHLRNTIRLGRYFRDANSGNVIAVYGRAAVVMTVRGSGGTVIIRTIEPASQFVGRVSARFTQIPNPFL